MFTNFKPYPEYAESGVTWLGPTPVHWNVRRAKYLFRDIDVRSKTGHEEQLSVSHLTGVSPRRMKTITMFKAVSYVGHKTCLPGDLVVNTMWAWMGALGIAREAGLVSPAYNVYRPPRTSGVNVEFVAVLFRTPTYIAYFRSHSTGLRPSRLRFYPDELLATPVLLPPWDEQAAIVKYLGHANAQIDRAIAGQRKLIELLEEQKQVIIDHAVTCGLGRPDQRESPAHWKVARLATLVSSAVTGLWGDEPTEANVEDHVVCVRVADFDTAQMEVSTERLTLRAVPRHAKDNRILRPGDLLLEKSGGGEKTPVGRVVEFRGEYEAITSNFVSRLRPNADRILPRFLLYSLHALQARGATVPFIKQTTGIQNLDGSAYLRNPVAFPELAEQTRIVEYLASSTRVIDVAASRAREEVTFLREFRTRLTADVVTGQLDVREAASRLPDLNPADFVSHLVELEDDDLGAEATENFEDVEA
jgi:type I restriction enzyme, S subunit